MAKDYHNIIYNNIIIYIIYNIIIIINHII